MSTTLVYVVFVEYAMYLTQNTRRSTYIKNMYILGGLISIVVLCTNSNSNALHFSILLAGSPMTFMVVELIIH